MHPYTTFQGVGSPTFSPPPLDGSVLLPGLVDFHAKNSGSHPVFQYEANDKTISYISWERARTAIHHARQLLQNQLLLSNGTTNRPVIAILANSDTMSFFAVMHGLIQAGFIPFPISTRNSTAAILHLLKATKCIHMIVSCDEQLQGLTDTVEREYSRDATLKLQLVLMPTFEALYATGIPVKPVPESIVPRPDDIAVIYHSSGSTSLPQAIYLSHRLVVQICTLPYYGEINLCEQVLAFQASPLYHLMGFWATSQMISSGWILAVFPPLDVPLVPTPERMLASIVALHCTILFIVPSFLEEWSKDREAMAILRSCLAVFFGGGALSQEAGTILSANNVPIATTYGLTETGMLSVLHVPSVGWDWFKQAPHIDLAFVPEGNDTFRVYIKESTTFTPAILNSEVDGVEAYDTKDLVVQHPTNPDYWQLYGRSDDQIIHSTGEKTNPGPIERALQNDPHIHTALVFGRSKFQPGVLILPSQACVFDPKDATSLADFRNKIWQTVSTVNGQAPQHSRIYKEMIIVASPLKPFEFTSKHSPQRGAIMKAYHDEIDAVYNAVELVSRPDIPLPKGWNANNISIFLRKIVHDVLGQAINDDRNFFVVGGDSLAATSIRNSVVRALRDSKAVPLASLRNLPQNFVYEFPTIFSLGAFVRGFVIGGNLAQNSAEDGDEFEEVTVPNYGETVVKLRGGRDEPPLIMIHGAAGLYNEYISYSEKFRTAVWTLQVTTETPLSSLDDLAAFYFTKIKEQQPTGPYRLAAYSGTSILAIGLAKCFEQNGDQVLQLAMLDHFPLMYVYMANQLGNADPRVPENRAKYYGLAIECISSLMKNDETWGILGKTYQNLIDAFNGLPSASEHHKTAASVAHKYIGLVSDFVYDIATDQEGVSSIDKMNQWMASVHAPVTVYIASTGVQMTLDTKDEKWVDLGTQLSKERVNRVVHAEGGHYQFLLTDTIICDLQVDY